MRTGSYSFHSERFRKSYRIFQNRYEVAASARAWLRIVNQLVAGQDKSRAVTQGTVW